MNLGTLQRYFKQHRTLPQAAKVSEVLGLAPTVDVFTLLSRLTEAGDVQRVDGRLAPGPLFFARPLLGSVRAGVPEPASQEPAPVVAAESLEILGVVVSVMRRLRR